MKSPIANDSLFLPAVEYWRNRYQRMNKERFVAANVMALVTHGLVSSSIKLNETNS